MSTLIVFCRCCDTPISLRCFCSQHCQPAMSRILLASDGLRARDNGEWAKNKLSFLDVALRSVLAATKTKRDRIYVDLFAGPGMNRVGESGPEFEGSPLRVLRAVGLDHSQTVFTRAIFVNANREDHRALQVRVDRALTQGRTAVRDGRIEVRHGDANRLLPEIMASIHPLAYVFVFADIEGPKQWPWSSVTGLKAGGHKSVDLYTLFPLDMAITRLIACNHQPLNQYAPILTSYFGTDAWTRIGKGRVTNAQSPELRRELVELYRRQLRTQWTYADEVLDVFLRGHQRLYKMMFASAHPAAKAISAWAAKEMREAENLGLGL
jgi:three-Cys-motif partner protein